MAFGQTSGIEKTLKCASAIGTAYTIAKFALDDDTLDVASSSTDTLIGVFQHTTDAAGEQVRVMVSGISRLKLGGTVTRGDFVTSTTGGLGVAAAPATGVNASIVGVAMASGASGDIVPVLIQPGRIQG